MSDTLLDRILGVSHVLQRDMTRAFAGTPLTEARVAALWVLHHGGPMTQRSVADALRVSPKNVSVLVDALAESGHVRRAAHPTDRRAVALELTDESHALMAAMSDQHAQLAATLAAAVGPADLPAVERGIDAILARLEQLVVEHAAAEPASGRSAPRS